MRRLKTAIMILSAMSCALGAGAVTLPFTDGFDTDISNQWDFGSGEGVMTNDPVAKVGSHALYSEENVKLAIDAGYTQVWFNCYTILAPFPTTDEPPSISTNAAAFYLDADGNIKAFSNNVYVTVATGVATNGWHGFSVQLDFDKGAWNLYHKEPGLATNTALELLNTAAPLLFNTNYTGSGKEITMIEVSGITLLDDVAITRSSGVTLGEPPLHYTATAPLILDGEGTGLDMQYFGATVNLLSPAGQVVGGLFQANDEIHLWNGTDFVIAKWLGNAWDTDFTIKPTTGFFIKRAGSNGTNLSSRVVYSTISSHQAAGATTLHAGNGWNLLAIPSTAGNRVLGSAGLPAGLNDQIFLWTSNGWSISRFDGSKWMPNIDLPAGRTFWLRRRGATTNNTWQALN